MLKTCKIPLRGILENPAVIKFNLILVVFITAGLITKGTSLEKPLLLRLALNCEEYPSISEIFP
jgi:hypothetical protein